MQEKWNNFEVREDKATSIIPFEAYKTVHLRIREGLTTGQGCIDVSYK